MALRFRLTTVSDLDFVLALEGEPDVAPFICAWSRSRHAQAISDGDERHLIIVDGQQRVGFALLAGLATERHSVELRRIVVSHRGSGLGRKALGLIIEHVFRDLRAHRLWLDVKPCNERALRVYGSLGFVREGVLRDALLVDGRYQSLAVMSLLRHEWRGPQSGDRAHSG